MLRGDHLAAIRRALAAWLAVAAPARIPAQEPADLVLRGGRIYTMAEGQPVAEAVAARGDRIVFVGSGAEVARFVGPGTRVVELGERIAVPGLTDAHCHLAAIGRRELVLNLEGATGPDEVARRLAARVREVRPGEWITGRGWIETHWTPRRFLTRADLDHVAPRNPVYLERADGHAAVANGVALQLAGINRGTRPPSGGDILRDAGGEPTGMLIDNAMLLVESRIPPPSAAELDRFFVVGAERSVRLGWTEVHDAGGLDLRGDWDEVDRLRRLFRERRIKLRVYKAVYGPGAAADSLLRRGPSVGESGGRFTARTIKLRLDGALGSRGALLLQPYSDARGRHGLLTTDLPASRAMLREALRRGIQVETHAIGDSANRLLLDLYAEAFEAVPPPARAVREPRWRDEHTQVLAPADIPRFRALGVIPSMQPSHAISDLHFAPARLGPDRVRGAYAWRSLLATGVVLAGGSDAPVERGEPMIEFYAAVARRDTNGFQGPDWQPGQALTREEALRMFTTGPAFAAFEEDRRGSIEVGKWADFTVLSADIMRIPEQEILTTRAVMTVVGGDVVYSE
ncbi:MAG TPA: amidohydrolase [Gemmatimonadales bacterium]|nr:amidohydrolase [Gemmatimonadales bacterium]